MSDMACDPDVELESVSSSEEEEDEEQVIKQGGQYDTRANVCMHAYSCTDFVCVRAMCRVTGCSSW